jgi:CelD/BcsL family acetyltransferase involved in cellulose biosynthesis
MRFTILSAQELNPDLVRIWRELQSRNPCLSSPFFCPEFTVAVGEIRDGVKIAVIEENGKIVAFFPWQKGKAGTGEAVGGRLSDYHGVICAPEFRCDGFALLKACSLAAWDFDHLVAAQGFFAPFHRKIAASPFIDLSLGFDAWRAKCKAVRSEQITIRRLQRAFSGIRLETHCNDSRMLALIMAWKSAQYVRTGRKWGFDPQTTALIQHLHRIQTPHFAGILSVLYVGDTPVAGHFGMRSTEELHWWFPAYSTEHARYSPGTVLLIKMAEAANSAGLTRIDLGKGRAQYKDRFKTGENLLAEGSIERPSLVKIRRRVDRMMRNTERAIRVNSRKAAAQIINAASEAVWKIRERCCRSRPLGPPSTSAEGGEQDGQD